MAPRPSDKLDFLEQDERRKYQRFNSSAFLGTPLYFTPLPPYFGEQVQGQVIDLSGGGMAAVIRDSLPLNSQHVMELKFPGGMVLSCQVAVRRCSSCTGGYFTGLEFMDLPESMSVKIDQMARDYNECDKRIADNVSQVCFLECSFISICEKFQKRAFLRNLENKGFQLKLKPVE